MGWFTRCKTSKAADPVVDHKAELAELDRRVDQQNADLLLRARVKVEEEAEETFEALPTVDAVKQCPKCLGRSFERRFGPYVVSSVFMPEQLPSEKFSSGRLGSNNLTVRSKRYDVLRLTCYACEFQFMSKTADYIKPAKSLTLEKPGESTSVVSSSYF